ncbi:MAG: flagellar biosynthetic protein FliR [Lachnospiraceae bacterium]|nr:flagellar biosynthetic protein FliR [Lachnospiraceae bacterium]
MIDLSFTYGDLELFLLVLMRTASFIFIAPFFHMTNTPRNIRIGFALILSVIVYGLIPHTMPEYHTLIEYTVIVLKEVITGLLVGLGANLCTYIVQFAGHLADMEMGLSMASLMDPATRQQTTISGIYYNYMIMLLLIISGMQNYLIRAFVETYELIPVNGQVFQMHRLLNSITSFMGRYILIGFRICLPIFCTMILLNAVLGVLAKVSPQLNMFAVGMQIKVLVGISVLFLTVALLPKAADMIYTEMKTMVASMVEGMSPT